MSIARIDGNSTEQFIRASIAINYKHSDPRNKPSHVQFKLDDDFTPDMLKLLGFKGLNYHLRKANGKYHFTVKLENTNVQ
jgi:hypothetical protein